VNKRLMFLLLVLVGVSYSQRISAGPFRLMYSKAESRAQCKSMTAVEPSWIHGYEADIGDGYEWQLWFRNDKLWMIQMKSFSSSMDAYEEMVKVFSKEEGRRPDNKSAYATGYSSVWNERDTRFSVIYNDANKEIVIILSVKQ